MYTTHTCPQCESTHCHLLYTIPINSQSLGWTTLLQHNKLKRTTLHIAHCRHCGLSFRRERFTNNELMVMYGSTGAPNQRQPSYPKFWPRSQEVFTHTEQYATINWAKAKILDFGGGQGELSHWFAQHHGSHCDILDFGATLGPLEAGMQRIGNLPNTTNTEPQNTLVLQYDFIMLNHVLEHVNDPTRTLAELHAVCHANTVLYAEVPYELFHYHVLNTQGHYEHINYFSVGSVHNLIVLAGFMPLSVKLRMGFGNTIPVIAGVFKPQPQNTKPSTLQPFSAWQEVYHPKIIALWVWAKLKLRCRWRGNPPVN